MKQLFDEVSQACSTQVTEKYSTSFSLATKILSPSIRQDIYNIYGFVRFADEIVDSFHDYDKRYLLDKFQTDLDEALRYKISLNPILNSFQYTVHKYDIDTSLINAFMYSMRLDLDKKNYLTNDEYKKYIYGSADVVGLMCLKVFVKGDNLKYESLKTSAIALGSAFQKVNFLRDLKADLEGLERSYFPNLNLNFLDETTKSEIIADIENDFAIAIEGIHKLPIDAKLGVYVAYRYYSKLLNKLKQIPSNQIKENRIRIPDYQKITLLARSYFKYQLNLL